MAQRKRGRAAQRRKTAGSGKTRIRAAAKGKAPKRRSVKAASLKKSAKAKMKRAVAKMTQPKTAKPRERPKALPIEVVKLERVGEPAPGVVVVSEFESVEVGPTSATAEST